MKKVDFGIFKAFQFLVLLFFTFAILLYSGSILLIALTIWQYLAMIFSIFGSFLSAIISLAALVGLCYYIYKLPGLVDSLLELGMGIIKMGYKTVCHFGEMADKAKGEEPEKSAELQNPDQASAETKP